MAHQDLENSLEVKLEETRQTYESLQLLLKEDPESEELKQLRDEMRTSVQELKTSLTLLREDRLHNEDHSDSETDSESDTEEDSEVINER